MCRNQEQQHIGININININIDIDIDINVDILTKLKIPASSPIHTGHCLDHGTFATCPAPHTKIKEEPHQCAATPKRTGKLNHKSALVQTH